MAGRILIVDDEISNVLLLEEYLANTGTEIRSVTDPCVARQVCIDFQPDIVLLDLDMPNLAGWDILRCIRAERLRQGFVPLVVLTAESGDVARKRDLLLDADDFLTKPLDRDEVALRIHNLLQARQFFAELAETYEALQQGRTG